MNAKECLVNVEKLMEELGSTWKDYSRITRKGSSLGFKISAIYNECGIFDWFTDALSEAQLKQMRTFLKQAINLGFDGYVCFKVGAKYCAHGMWAHKNESTTGYSPDGDVLYHSFRSDENYYDVKLDDIWLHDVSNKDFGKIKLADIKEALKNIEKN